MKVTIITTCFNRIHTISDCVKSVLAQDYPNIEYIVVDGASTDGTLEQISKLRDEVLTEEYKAAHPGFSMEIISEKDNGMYEALNKGMRRATGDVIGLVHSDDVLFSPQTISHIAHRFEETGADFLYGDGIFVRTDDTNRVVRNWIGGSYRLWKIHHGWLPLHPTCYIRRQVTTWKGIYNETYSIAADTDFLLRYLLNGDLTVTYLKEYIIRMRIGGLSTSRQTQRKMLKEDLQIFSSHGMNPYLSKIEKMIWKVPQFLFASRSKSK